MEYRNQGNDRLASYYEDLSLKHLGISLHPLQDSFAHTDDFVKTITIFGKTFYHYLYPGGSAADKPISEGKSDPRVSQNREATKLHLERFREEVGI